MWLFFAACWDYRTPLYFPSQRCVWVVENIFTAFKNIFFRSSVPWSIFLVARQLKRRGLCLEIAPRRCSGASEINLGRVPVNWLEFRVCGLKKNKSTLPGAHSLQAEGRPLAANFMIEHTWCKSLLRSIPMHFSSLLHFPAPAYLREHKFKGTRWWKVRLI